MQDPFLVCLGSPVVPRLRCWSELRVLSGLLPNRLRPVLLPLSSRCTDSLPVRTPCRHFAITNGHAAHGLRFVLMDEVREKCCRAPSQPAGCRDIFCVAFPRATPQCRGCCVIHILFRVCAMLTNVVFFRICLRPLRWKTSNVVFGDIVGYTASRPYNRFDRLIVSQSLI